MNAIFSEIFSAISQYQYWLTLFVGVFCGLILGATPGISATMSIALLVPFTFGMDIVQSITLLIGIYFATIYGGSIPAILFKTIFCDFSLFANFFAQKSPITDRGIVIAK